MKKVRAKHWLKVENAWYGPGEIFDVESTAGITNAIEVISTEPETIVEEPVKVAEPVKAAKEPEQEKSPKTAATRRRKATAKQ